MILPDVNVLVYALRPDAPDHVEYRTWLESAVNSAQPFALSPIVLSGVCRVLTHPRIFAPPSEIGDVLAELQRLRERPNVRMLPAGPRHWDIFSTLCRSASAAGNLVADAYLAAIAIESGSTFVTTDRDFARFPRLLWRHPLEPPVT